MSVMASKNNSREMRVLGLLKDMEESIVEQEGQARRLLDDFQDSLGNILPDDLFGRPDRTKKYCSTAEKTPQYLASYEWKNISRDAKRPNTTKTPTSSGRREPRVPTAPKSPAGGGKKERRREGSDTSIDTTSSKVQQLKLFWDKFFLMETAPDKSSDLIDKSRFLSEAKYEVLDKPKRKAGKKCLSKILEKTIPPSRVPISFRMVPSRQNRPKKRLTREESYSNINLTLSREVSTCVAKIPKSDESSETGSDNSVSSHRSDSNEDVAVTEPIPPDSFKKKLYKFFLIDQINDDPNKNEKEQRLDENDEIRKIDKNTYKHSESGRLISCLKKKGFSRILNENKPFRRDIFGVIVEIKEATFIDSSFLNKKKKSQRKPRKYSTLLPCYYCTIHENAPVELAASGDASHLYDTEKKLVSYRHPPSNYCVDDSCRFRGSVMYEKTIVKSTVEPYKTHIKLIICQDEPIARPTSLVLIAFSSVALIGFTVIIIKLCKNEQIFCQ